MCDEVWPLLRAELKELQSAHASQSSEHGNADGQRQTSGHHSSTSGSVGLSPEPELHIYGAYATQAAQQFHRPRDGIHMKGFAPSLDIMQQYKVINDGLYGNGISTSRRVV